jgi:hypothetical protein
MASLLTPAGPSNVRLARTSGKKKVLFTESVVKLAPLAPPNLRKK